MALTYGFYNSIEGDRVYDAIQFGRIFDGIIKDGVYATYEKGMMVIASDNASEVIIQPGRAWFNHTWSYNDANVIFEAPAPEVLLERIDTLVLEVNEELSARENSYKWVTGTPSSRPVAPTLTNTSTIHQYPLCDVHRYPETTMIYTRDITNRIGTSDCPFATGVLEGIDLDAWINQWDDEFHNWENETKSDYDTWERTVQTQFETWMLNQESVFTAWYNAFKSQMQDDVTEVENFVAYLETVLDASTAVHLQEEIDDLKGDITAGSHITVTTINTELYNRNVTITEPAGTVITSKFDGTGVAEFKSVPYVGNLTISSTYGDQTAERVVNTPYYARYSFAIAFWAATVNISGDIEFAGETVTIKDSNNVIVGTVVLDNLGTGVYTAIKPDTYKFTLTYGGETMEVTLSVTQETTYTVELHAAGFKWEDWLEAGGVTGSYSSLDDVLADEVALRRLFTVHASVDYMAGINDENEDVEKIIGTDLAAKWINLRDYALDTLYANETIAGYMDTADKYGYGEWALVGQVPKMTSNSAPYGEAIATSSRTNCPAYAAFDGNWEYQNSVWCTLENQQTNARIAYHFTEATIVKRFKVLFHNSYYATSYKIQASNDGTNWVDLATFTDGAAATITHDIENSTPYLYYGLTSVVVNPSYNYFAIGELQFYAWQPKGNVPAMTSNTAPYGEAGAESASTNYPAYKAFNNSLADCWQSTNYSGSTVKNWIRYKFANPVCLKKISYMQADPSQTSLLLNSSYTVWYSNDDTNRTQIGEAHSLLTSKNIGADEIENDVYALYWWVLVESPNLKSGSNYYFTFRQLQFYGRELSSLVPLMTSNTTPYGEAKVTNAYSAAREAWKSFAGPDSNSSLSNSRTGSIQYKFTNAQTILFVSMKEQGNHSQTDEKAFAKDLEFYVSDDDSTWTKVGQGQNTNYTSGIKYYHKVANPQKALYFRVKALNTHIASGDPSYLEYGFVQFYGLDYSEKEFEEGTNKKWLYDHGVELETITISGTVTKGTDAIQLTAANAQATASVDTTAYSLVRGKVGAHASGTNQLICGSGVSNFTTSNMPYNNGFDVSSVNGSNAVGVKQTANGIFDATEFWLE